MSKPHSSGPRPFKPARSAAVAAATSVVLFTAIHHIWISDIWFSLPIMLVAGVSCGLAVAWSYALLADAPSLGGWVRYNLLYVALLALLGIISVLVFEPVTTMAAVTAADRPPDALIGQALPLTALFTPAGAILIALLYRPSWLRFSAVLLSCTLVILFLGLNVSIIGLVSIPRGSLYLIAEMFGLILALNLIFVAAFGVLEREQLLHTSRGTALPAGPAR